MFVDVEIDRHQPPLGLDSEGFSTCAPRRIEVASKDPQAVAGLLRFTAIGIVDPHTEIRLARWRQGEDAVRAGPPVSVADGSDVFRCQAEIEVVGVEGDIVVAQTVPLEKGILHLSAETSDGGSDSPATSLSRYGRRVEPAT